MYIHDVTIMHGNHAYVGAIAGHGPTLYYLLADLLGLLYCSTYYYVTSRCELVTVYHNYVYISVIDMYTPYTQLHQTLHNIVTEEEHY